MSDLEQHAPYLVGAAALLIAVKVYRTVRRLDPTNPDNAINQGVTGALQGAGLVSQGGSIGGDLFDFVQRTRGAIFGTPTDADALAPVTRNSGQAFQSKPVDLFN